MKKAVIVKPVKKFGRYIIYGQEPHPKNALLLGVDNSGVPVSLKVSDGETRYELLREMLMPVDFFLDGKINPVYLPSDQSLAPAVLTFGTSTSTTNLLNWTADANAENFEVQLLNIEGEWETLANVTSLTYLHIGLSSSTSYTYRIVSKAEGYITSTSENASKSTAASENDTVFAEKFLSINGTISQGIGTLTVLTNDARIVVANPSDINFSTLPVLSIESAYDNSWVGTSPSFGMSIYNYGETLTGTQFALIFETTGLRYRTDSVPDAALGYVLPLDQTAKMRVRAVAGATTWDFVFETSEDGGTTWTNRNPGGVALLSSAIPTSSNLFGNIYGVLSGTVFREVKVAPLS